MATHPTAGLFRYFHTLAEGEGNPDLALWFQTCHPTPARRRAMNKEQVIRDAAYAIWQAEGRPDGRAADHWRQAQEQVEMSASSRGPAENRASVRSSKVIEKKTKRRNT
jgi:Protein of unknown function (DUF2934)